MLRCELCLPFSTLREGCKVRLEDFFASLTGLGHHQVTCAPIRQMLALVCQDPVRLLRNLAVRGDHVVSRLALGAERRVACAFHVQVVAHREHCVLVFAAVEDRVLWHTALLRRRHVLLRQLGQPNRLLAVRRQARCRLCL